MTKAYGYSDGGDDDDAEKKENTSNGERDDYQDEDKDREKQGRLTRGGEGKDETAAAREQDGAGHPSIY